MSLLSPTFAVMLLSSFEPAADITTLFPPQCSFLIEANKDQLKSLRPLLKQGLDRKYISQLSVLKIHLYVSLLT